MTDSETPDLNEYYRLKVKLPDELDEDPSRVQAFLSELATKIHAASGDVSIMGDEGDPIGHDRAGDPWARGTLAIPMNLGCGTKHGDYGHVTGDDEDENHHHPAP